MRILKILGKILIFFVSLSTAAYSATSIHVNGKLLDENGNPMPLSHVHVGSFSFKVRVKHFPVEKDGSFELTLEKKHLYKLQFTGVGHNMLEIPFIDNAESKTNFTIKLQPYQYDDTIKDVKLLCSLNNFKPHGAFAMRKNFNNKYIYDTTITPGIDTFAYEILGIEHSSPDHGINGTQSDYYSYDNDGDYFSVIKISDGKVHIEFDPDKLNRVLADYTIQSDPIALKKISYTYANIRSMRNKMKVFEIGNGDNEKLLNQELQKKALYIADAISAENDKISREMLLLSYLELSSTQIITGKVVADKQIINKIFTEVPVGSEVWNMYPSVLPMIILGVTKNSSVALSYFDNFVKIQTDSANKIEVLYNVIQYEAYVNNVGLKEKYLKMLEHAYPKNPITIEALKSYSSEKR